MVGTTFYIKKVAYTVTGYFKDFNTYICSPQGKGNILTFSKSEIFRLKQTDCFKEIVKENRARLKKSKNSKGIR